MRRHRRFGAAAALLAAAVAAAAAAAEEPPRIRQGPYEIVLHLPPNGLFAGEEMEIEFSVARADRLDASGEPTPLTWARIEAVADMPSMPSMAPFDEIAHREESPGRYGVHPTFPHGGDYRLCLTILPPEIPLVGDPRPTEAFVFDFPLTVADAASSPTRESAKVRPFSLDLATAPLHPVAGQPVELELRVRLAGSFEQREVVDFDVQHEKLMHLFVVSEDLTEFAHEHPELSGPGVFRLSHAFARPGRYRLFVDVAPHGAGSQVLSATVAVGGSGAPARAATPSAPPTVRAVLELPPEGIPAGRTVTVTAHIHDAKGRPVSDLEPWLGAMGHLLLVHQDAATFAHAHPDDREPGIGKDGRLPFLVRLPKPGSYKGWLQVKRAGRVETIELALDAGPAANVPP
ncbi:MAG TPA: hypothetical protein VMH79_08615 [Thermoanaerobaculia bacterium]|nr:hypothetical protein [Thermoanaerobaculia bacterium]